MKRVLALLAVALLASSCGWTDDKSETSTGDLPASSSTTAAPSNGAASDGEGGGSGTEDGGGNAAARGCATTAFPTWLDGRPATMATATADGVYVWMDKYGLRIRAKGVADPATVLEVVVTADSRIKVMKPRPEDLVYTNEGNRLEVSLLATSEGQGFDIDPCLINRFSVSVKANGVPWPTEALFVGSGGNAFGNPVDAARA